MTPEEIKLLRILAVSKAGHGGTIDARLVVMAIDTLTTDRVTVPSGCECWTPDSHASFCIARCA